MEVSEKRHLFRRQQIVSCPLFSTEEEMEVCEMPFMAEASDTI